MVAPAGYGKTTLLAQWAESKQPRLAWLSADHGDDDPTVLLKTQAISVYRKFGVSSRHDAITRMHGLRSALLELRRRRPRPGGKGSKTVAKLATILQTTIPPR